MYNTHAGRKQEEKTINPTAPILTIDGTSPADLGKDIGLRFRGASTSAIIDNVSVTDDSVPPPPSGTVIILR